MLLPMLCVWTDCFAAMSAMCLASDPLPRTYGCGKPYRSFLKARIAQLVDYQELLGTMVFPSDPEERHDFVLQLVEAIRKEPPQGKIARQIGTRRCRVLTSLGFRFRISTRFSLDHFALSSTW